MSKDERKDTFTFMRQAAQRLFSTSKQQLKSRMLKFTEKQVRIFREVVTAYVNARRNKMYKSYDVATTRPTQDSSAETKESSQSSTDLVAQQQIIAPQSPQSELDTVIDTIEEGRAPYVNKINELVSLRNDPGWAKGYVQRVNAEAKQLFGEQVEATDISGQKQITDTSLLNEQQLHQILDFLDIHKEKIADWFRFKDENRLFDDEPTENPVDILRIGKKPEQRSSQFQAGELPRSIEIHRIGDEFRIYVTPSKKLASDEKAEALARGGMAKKVTNMIWLNPSNMKQRLLDMVTKVQSTQEDVSTEVALEQKCYGAGATVIGEAYTSGNRDKVRTSEVAAIYDMFDFALTTDANKHFEMDNRHDPKEPSRSRDEIMEGLLADCFHCMQQIHDADVVHKDIKPENVLIFIENGRLRARITDFGLSASMSDSPTKRDSIEGTVSYLSPQHINHFLAYTLQTVEGATPQMETLARNFTASNEVNCYGKAVGYEWADANELDIMSGKMRIPLYTASPKDDMWAMGIMMYQLIAQKNIDEITPQAIDSAVVQCPLLKKHEALFRSLLQFDRDARPDAKTAMRMFNNPKPLSKQGSVQ